MSKIECGEFVDLEKLIFGDSPKGGYDERLEFVNREEQTYLAPVHEREPRISGVRHWEQAFRVYAAIYSKANPMRSAEIWQYVHTINTAVTNFAWENVAYYDYTFRQMMSQNPLPSWAKTYTQLWNIALCTPNQRFSSQSSNNSYNNSGGSMKRNRS